MLGNNLTLGTLVRSDDPWDGACTKANLNSVYSALDGLWLRNLVVFFGGSCTEFSDSAGTFTYYRCW